MTDLTELARDILNGDTLPFGQHGVYDSADWIDAAQQALDPVDQDFTDIRAMVAKEEAAKAMAASKELIELAYAFGADGSCEVVTSWVSRYGDGFFLASEAVTKDRFGVDRSIHCHS